MSAPQTVRAQTSPQTLALGPRRALAQALAQAAVQQVPMQKVPVSVPSQWPLGETLPEQTAVPPLQVCSAFFLPTPCSFFPFPFSLSRAPVPRPQLCLPTPCFFTPF